MIENENKSDSTPRWEDGTALGSRRKSQGLFLNDAPDGASDGDQGDIPDEWTLRSSQG